MKHLLLFLISSVLALNAFSKNPGDVDVDKALQKKPSLECRYLGIIEQGFLANHVKYSQRDPELQARVVEQLLKRIDPMKIYFTAQDVVELKKVMGDVFDKTKAKDCQFLESVHRYNVKKVEERVQVAKSFLDKNYKFDSKTEFVFDPNKQPWAKSDNEANDFLKKYIHFQISNYLATDMKLEEAKSNVLKNYDRILKNMKEKDLDELYSSYLDSFARSLDPHSSFFSRDVLEDFEIQMRLSLEGIGATLSSQDGFTVVESLVPGGAADKSGQIEPQDKIIAVAQDKGPMENVVDMDLKDVVKKIRGPKGTKVKLSILRKDGEGKQRLEVTLTREKVNLEDQAASILYIDKDISGQKRKIAVIDLPAFYADSKRGGRSSAADLKKLIKQAKANKAQALVLDLSTNGGGSLEDAVKIAGLFFKTGNVVKQSSKGESQAENTLKDTDSDVDWTGPLVILTSRISASASEIVSGTLQDYKRALVVGGDHTFGKGSVQSVLPIGDLGALKVTVGMFFLPGGNSTQHRGVEADIIFPEPFATDEFGEKSLDYSLPPKKIPSFLSEDAYVKSGADQWPLLKAEWIKELKDKSQMRVSTNEDFKKIVEETKKAEKRGKLIKVSDILSDKSEKEKKEKEKAKKTAKKEDRIKDYLKRADIQEAANIAADLAAMWSFGAEAKSVVKK